MLLFTLSQVSCKPFYWGDESYLTTKQPLLEKAFSKLDHWFRNLIDAYPSSTWHWKEHFYGRTYWKNPRLIRGWLSISERPLGRNYKERHAVRTNVDPLGFPGFTLPKMNPDFVDDNILSIPNTEELEKIEAKEKLKKRRPGFHMSGNDYEEEEEEEKPKSEEKKNKGNPRNVARGAAGEGYEKKKK